jgi:hypothetical protein
MKKLSILLSLIFLASCQTYKKKPFEINDKASFEVYKIDSINSYYLIYAKKADTLYKIVSNKEKVKECYSIRKEMKYKFKIHAVSDNAPKIGGLKIKPMNYLDVACYQFDKETKICREEGMYDIYYADNVKGLCFIKGN